MNNLPPLRSLPVFEAVARLNSFSRAADELHVTQSAVSHSIRQLEDHLGEALFIRAGRQLSLSEAGERYYDDIASALRRIEQASERLRGRPDRRVRLAVPSSLAVCWLIPRLKDFEARFPDIDLDLEMIADMPPMSGRIADCFLTIRYQQRGYESRSLYVERLFAICSPGYWQRLKTRLAERGLIDSDRPGPLRPEWLLDSRLLSAASIFEQEGEDWRRWFAAADLSMPPDQRLQHFSHMLLAHEAARHDQGIALANDYMVDAEHDPGLVRLPCHDFRTGDAFHFAYKQARREEPAIRALSGWLMGQASASGWAPDG